MHERPHGDGSAPASRSAFAIGRPGLRTLAALVAVGASLLAVGAYALADAQSGDRAHLRERYAHRATVASALVDSLFRAVQLERRDQASRRFGGDVSPAALEAGRSGGSDLYLAVLRPDGEVLAASRRAGADVLGRLRTVPAHVTMAMQRGYATSDAIRFAGLPRVVETAVRFESADGPRLLVSGAPVAAFAALLGGTLEPLAPVEGGDAFVLDSSGSLLAGVGAGASPAPIPDRQLVQRSAKQTAGTYDAGGRRFFVADDVPGTPWRIAASVPEAELYAPLAGAGRWLPWAILGLLGLALAAVAVLLRRTVDTGLRLAAANRALELNRGHLEDQTDRLQRSNRELERSNAELEQFAYVASHDLSAPLRAVGGFAELLSSRYADRLDPTADEYIGHIRGGVDRMQRIIDDLLAYSRVGRGTLRPTEVDLGSVLEQVLSQLGPVLTERGARVVHEPLPRVLGDEGQLGQVLQNLIANAITFVAPGVAPRVHVTAARSGDMWRIAVRDNGIGIDPAQADRVFRMFQRLHGEDRYPGTGIGLAIVQKIVERHGGRVGVEPAPGGGSVFSFTVPAPPGAEPPASTGAGSVESVA